jgi:hypothetical protein
MSKILALFRKAAPAPVQENWQAAPISFVRNGFENWVA